MCGKLKLTAKRRERMKTELEARAELVLDASDAFRLEK